MSFSMIISSSQFARSGWTYCPESSGWLREAVDSELEVFIFTVPVGDILRTCFFGHWKTFYVYVQSAKRRFQVRTHFIAPRLSANCLANKKTVFENGPEWMPLILECPIFTNTTHCVKFRLKFFSLVTQSELSTMKLLWNLTSRESSSYENIPSIEFFFFGFDFYCQCYFRCHFRLIFQWF